MMQILQGIAASPGVAIGEALIIDNERFRITRRVVPPDAVPGEIRRFHETVASVATEIEQRRDSVTAELGSQYGAIFSAHLQMVRDPQLKSKIESLIRHEQFSAEYAVSRTLRQYAEVFERMGNRYMAERAQDVFDIEQLLLAGLLGQRREELAQLTAPVVILAHGLTPSEIAHLDREFVLGFVTETGGAGGHVAIVAEALEIPAVVGVGRFLTNVSGGDQVIVNGDEGRVILSPDPQTLTSCRRDVKQHSARMAKLAGLRTMPAETADGTRVQLFANIEFPSELEACLERGADGIGLYRTEFLYIGDEHPPSEEEQYQAYCHVVDCMGDRPVVIRTLDLGADKVLHDASREPERNPFLGLRSIRLSLRHPKLFRAQLRAVLRASSRGNLLLMFPLVSTLSELMQAKTILAEVMDELERQEQEFNRKIPLGMMVEVPAVVMMLDRFINHLDFISIGTNDLIQYTLAVDRSNLEVASLYNASDPAVLRFIQMAVQTAARGSLPTTLCGQMCANPKYAMLLLGLGLRRLSLPPHGIPEIKQVCRSVSIPQCEALATQVLALDSAEEIDHLLLQELKRAAPELVAHP
jgi:phosphotransferase system enzyme I (PtsI)